MNRGRGMGIRRARGSASSTAQGLLCSYPHRVCLRNRINGYEYCCRHILEDKTAPYRQCNYVYPKNGRKCTNVSSKLEKKEGNCQEHLRKNLVLRQNTFRKRKPQETVTGLIDDLEHYNILSECSGESNEIPSEFNATVLSRLPLTTPPNRISQIIDYASDSESDSEKLAVDQTYKGVVESDAESVDSENEDLIRHAGVYNIDEATLITRDKLIRLQCLYIEQFKRLQHVLREKRRKYLHNLKLEKEAIGNPNAFIKSNLKEAENYKKLKALLNYHKLSGCENLMQIKAKEKRKATSLGDQYVPPIIPQCHFTSQENVKCSLQPLPLSKYCCSHILKDNKQVLYHPCSFQDSGCSSPVIFGFNLSSCKLHRELPPMANLELPRQPSPPPVKSGEEPDNMKITKQGSESAEVSNSQNDSEGLHSENKDGDVFIAPPQLWETSTTDSKLRQVLESIDMTPGELPPEELLDTS